ncbi:hypothetical protein [Alcanivorax sp. 24]|uniref:hypothetical protein n=1 Tax=Alcanivorax sp. 24 TaxID=2545266 RepID=UPI0010603E22|nr:hypothetical protein [Alcanivorax sp. 24]
MNRRLRDIWHSYRSLPLWVQLWVGLILMPVNLAGFFFLSYPAGQWIAVATVLIVLTNGPIMWYYAGMNKAMSLPHLIIWIPLHVLLIAHLAGGFSPLPMSRPEFTLIMAVLTANTISLLFDVKDSWDWLRGDRATPGF